MKIKPSKLSIPLVIMVMLALIVSIALNVSIKDRKRDANALIIPSLPKPIAKEYALITSAGQSTDAYIVSDAANKLLIHNYFMPQAQASDLEGVKTLVFVVGYSSMGEKLHGTSYEDETKRIQGLLEVAKKANLVVMTVYIAGEQRRDKNSQELLGMVIPESDYIIADKGANKDGSLVELLKGSRVPITLINRPKDLSEPFASAFR